jgi:DNA invertase Pin-like site-specific DNA recombinase
MGHLILTVLGMVAQMERRFIKERQREGIDRAKSTGKYKGGTVRINHQRIRELSASGVGAIAIAKAIGCSRMQVYRVLNSNEL